MNLHEMMTRKTFPPLEVGNHTVVILGHEVRKTPETGEDYLYVSFAPSNELEHVHGIALFVNDKVNFVQGFVTNLQRILRLPGATLPDLLQAVKGIEIPANLALNLNNEGKTYYNWTLGWARPEAVQPAQPAAPAAKAPARKARA